MIQITETKTLKLEEREFLKRALEELTIGEVLEQVEDNQGTLFLIKTDKLVGIAYFQVFGEILNLRCLSGVDTKEWAEEFQEFVIELMRKYRIPHFVIYSRKGWNRMFPKLKFEGAIYSFHLDSENQASLDA